MNKKILSIFVLVLTLLFTTQAFASLTFTTNAITGTTASSIDLGASNDLFLQTSGGKVGIGTTAPSVALDVVGSINIPTGSAYMYNGLNIITAQTDRSDYFFGNGAGNSTMTGSDNTAIGFYVLYPNTTGYSNVAIGSHVLESNTTGYANVAIGSSGSGLGALGANTIGNSNVAIGQKAAWANETGNYNVAIGVGALYSNIGSSNVALGYMAGKYETGSNAFYVDNQSRGNTAGDKAGALLYGTFDATPANQTLKINAKITAGSATNKGTVALVGGTATVTVNTGAVCVVSETTTATNGVKGVVSGTTLTITGTGTDTIAYICL